MFENNIRPMDKRQPHRLTAENLKILAGLEKKKIEPEKSQPLELTAQNLSIPNKPEREAINPSNFMALEKSKTKGTNVTFDTKNEDLYKQLKSIVADQHLEELAKVCSKYNYTIAIRETGIESIKRIAQGAKPKPHTILEKSIKLKSVKKAYSNTSEDPNKIMDRIKQLDLDGFVGHWGPSGLLGVRITNPPEGVNVQSGGKDENEEEILYVPVDLEAFEGGVALQQLKKSENNWQKHLFTGDYDLHEAYKNNGQIAEATPEKVKFLTYLNRAVAKVDPNRGGEFHIKKGKLGIKKGAEHAMFQHGDQATYHTNQLFENQDKNDPLSKAELVKSVAQESDEPIAWLRQGKWYVTQNIQEHDMLRKQFGVTKPSCWDQAKYDKLNTGERRNSAYSDYSASSASSASSITSSNADRERALLPKSIANIADLFVTPSNSLAASSRVTSEAGSVTDGVAEEQKEKQAGWKELFKPPRSPKR